MTREELDALYARTDKTLPARPDWRDGTQLGTRRAYVPVSLDGHSAGLRIAITARPLDPGYLVANLIANKICVARLCLSGGHRDRRTRQLVLGGHYHRWQDNRPNGSKIGKSLKLLNQVGLPQTVASRDDAFALFLTDCGIESPSWWPMNWPADQVLF